MYQVAIFNSMPFHYEMFGYIIHYCQQKEHKLVIYTNFKQSLHWHSFYVKHFSDYFFEFKDVSQFEEEKYIYDLIVITTDDDLEVKKEWFQDTRINRKLVCVDHSNMIRTPKIPYSQHLAVRPFPFNHRKWALPCYPIVENATNRLEKWNYDNTIHVVVVGGQYNKYNVPLFNRLRSEQGSDILLSIVSRSVDREGFQDIKIPYKIYENMNTDELMHLVQRANYVLTDCTSQQYHIKGLSMSASIPLAFSNLTPLLISQQGNKGYQFQSAIEFDLESTDDIVLENNCMDFERVQIMVEERKGLMDMLQSYLDDFLENKIPLVKIPKKMFQTWKTKDLSDIVTVLSNSWKKKNPEYDYYLFDDSDCDEYIKLNFDPRVYKAYQKIIPGALKADLWRYCVLYIQGGVYIDLDTFCLGSIDDLLDEDIEFMTPIDLNRTEGEGEHNLFNAFMAIEPCSEIMLNSILRVLLHVERNILTMYSKLDFSGPGVLGRSTNLFLKQSETSSFVGKEGKIGDTILLLHFDPKTEFVSEKETEKKLFLNKNGSPELKKLYKEECDRLQVVDYLYTTEFLA